MHPDARINAPVQAAPLGGELHACKYTYTGMQSARIRGVGVYVEGVDEREAITRFTRGNTLLTFTGERNPPNAPPRLIPARLVPIRKFYGKYDTWGNTVEMHLALCTPPNHRAFIKEEKERKERGNSRV